jgi:hypothetical protein
MSIKTFIISQSNVFFQIAVIASLWFAAHWFIAPSMWWCIIDELTRTRKPRLDLLALVACPNMFALWWAAEATSFYGSDIESILKHGRLCFCWAHATKMPRIIGTQTWQRDLKKRCKTDETRQMVFALLILGYVQMVLHALTLRGSVGIIIWSLSLKKTTSKKRIKQT